jgi:hypothetical protein
MKKADEIYDNSWGWWDYQPMLNEFGNIILQKDEQNYQGDSFLIYEKDDKYGYLTFGWGSCSGCDALQGCNSISEVQELMDRLYSSIEWFDSLDALKEYFEETDWTLQYQYSIPEFKEFLIEVENL